MLLFCCKSVLHCLGKLLLTRQYTQKTFPGIVNLDGYCPNYHMGTTYAERRREIRRFEELAEDDLRPIRRHLIQWVEYLHSCLLRHKRILVFCKQGAQRSALVVCGVIMALTGLRADSVV